MLGKRDVLAELPTDRGRKRFLRVAILCTVVVVTVAMTVHFTRATHDGTPGVYTLEKDDLLYTYHRLSDSDSLFDTKADPECRHNLAHRMPELTREMRHRLSVRLGVRDLVDLPFEFSHGSA